MGYKERKEKRENLGCLIYNLKEINEAIQCYKCYPAKIPYPTDPVRKILKDLGYTIGQEFDSYWDSAAGSDITSIYYTLQFDQKVMYSNRLSATIKYLDRVYRIAGNDKKVYDTFTLSRLPNVVIDALEEIGYAVGKEAWTDYRNGFITKVRYRIYLNGRLKIS